MCKYPEIHVKLSGTDGNAFSIIAKVSSVLRKSGLGKEEVAIFTEEAMSGDYSKVLQTCMAWVSVT